MPEVAATVRSRDDPAVRRYDHRPVARPGSRSRPCRAITLPEPAGSPGGSYPDTCCRCPGAPAAVPKDKLRCRLATQFSRWAKKTPGRALVQFRELRNRAELQSSWSSVGKSEDRQNPGQNSDRRRTRIPHFQRQKKRPCIATILLHSPLTAAKCTFPTHLVAAECRAMVRTTGCRLRRMLPRLV